MRQLPRMQSDNREINQLQNNIVDNINPIFRANPILFGNIVKTVSLKVGSNNINTGLSQPLQGWIIVRKRGPANIYDTQDSNRSPETLALVSDAAVSVDILMF